MNKRRDTGRLIFIDVFRAIAIILVVAAHCVVSVPQKLPYIQTSFDDVVYKFGIFNLGAPFFRGHLGVWIFFCISGYTMALIASRTALQTLANPSESIPNRIRGNNFLRRRLQRIYPLFVIHIVLMNMVVSSSLKSNVLSLLFLSNLAKHSITAVSPVMWSLVVEMQFYFVFPYIYRLTVSRTKRLLTLFFLSLPLLILLHYIFWNTRSTQIEFILGNNLLPFIPFFLFGMLLFEYRRHVVTYAALYWLRIASWIALAVLLFVDTGRNLSSTLNLSMLVATSLFAAFEMTFMSNIITQAKHPSRYLIEGLGFIGQASYSIYLFHLFPIIMLSRANVLSAGTLSLVQFISGLAVGVMAYILLEIPLSKITMTFQPSRGSLRENDK